MSDQSFLLVTWDGGGNTPPMRAIAAELLARGRSVRVVGPECRRQAYESLGARFEAYQHAPEHDAGARETDLVRDWEARTPIGAFARMRDNLMFGPAAAFAREVEAAVERERPAGAVIDYMLTGAAAGARRAGVPSAGLVHNVYPLPADGVPPFGMGLAPARGRAGRLRDRLLAQVALRPFAVGLDTLNRARRELGLPEVAHLAALLDDFAVVLVAVPPEFDLAARARLPPAVRFVGNMAPPASEQVWRGPWPADDHRPLVVVSLSTTFMDQRGLARRVLQGLNGMPVRALFTVGPALELDDLPIPDNVVLAGYIPHAAVLPQASAVVTHAGLGTIAAALSAGVPLVCIPSGRDQPDNAVRVVEGGAGIRLPQRARPAKIRMAIERVLSEPQFRRGARRMQQPFERDGAGTAVTILEKMITEAGTHFQASFRTERASASPPETNGPAIAQSGTDPKGPVASLSRCEFVRGSGSRGEPS